MDQRLWRPARKAPVKQKKPDRYIKLPLWFASAAAKATNTRKAMVWIWLVWLALENRSLEFPVPNGRLRQWGVSRYTKDKALRELEAAGLIVVTRQRGKTVRVALITL
jgi:hypothetical protein